MLSDEIEKESEPKKGCRLALTFQTCNPGH
jgi:hypothetical protein